MDNSFVDLLQSITKTSIITINNYTHVTLFDPEKKWSIPDTQISTFWKSYCDIVAKESENLYVAEKNTPLMPVIFDFKLRYYKDSDISEPYNEEVIKYIVASIQEAICDLFCTSESFEELNCCVLSSSNPWEEFISDTDYMVIKLRFHFPSCRIHVENYASLRTKLIRLLHDNKVMAKFPEKPTGDWDVIIDQNTILKPLLMYGSSNNSDEPRFVLDNIFGSIDIDEYGDIEQVEELYLDNMFSRKHHSDYMKGLISDETLDNEDLEFWLPMLLSVNYPLTIIVSKEKDQSDSNSSKENKFVSEKINVTLSLLKITSPKRFADPVYNKEIGKAIYHVYEGDTDGLNVWIDHTKKAMRSLRIADNIIEETIEKLDLDYWLYSDTPITERTIAWYAKEDDNDKYNTWHKQWCSKALDASLSGLHADVAEAFYRYRWLYHICIDPKGPLWYMFHKNRMIKDSKGLGLKNYLSRDFVKIYEHLRLELVNKSLTLTDGNEKDKIEDKIKCIMTMIKNLKTEPYKRSIMQAVQENFIRIDFDFYGTLDSNLDLMGLPNGVIEVYGDKCIIRPGKPEDFVTLKTGVPYRSDFHENHPMVKRYKKWLKCLFRDKQLRWEWRKFTSSLLKGGNNDKIFPIPTGGGGNGKSQMVKALETSLGNYCFNYPVELLSCKNKNPQGPSPATARGKGRHLAITTEPDEEDPLRKGLIKCISGNDRRYDRMLNENGGDAAASYVMSLWCNDIPIFPNADSALMNRVIIYPYLSVWQADAPNSFEEQMKVGIFKEDKFFDRQIPQLAQGLLWLAVQDYTRYKREGLLRVPVMIEAINKYWEESDIYFQYTGESIIRVKDEDGDPNNNYSKTVTEVYINFGKWFRQCYPGTRVPDRRIFKKEISKKWGEPIKSRWLGIIFTEEDSVTEEGGNNDAYDF